MTLTDQEITDNFNDLINHYLSLNNLTTVTYTSEQKEGENIIITSWDDSQIAQPTYETFRNYCLETVCQKKITSYYMCNSCPVVRNTLFKSLYKLFTETANMTSNDTIGYLATISGLTVDQINFILNN